MLTLEIIAQTHAKVKSGADFPRYVQDLKALGMSHYDFYVTDGHSEYFSVDGTRLDAPAKYETKTITSPANANALRHTITIHQQGQTDFLTFCQQAADAGVQYWRTDIVNLKCIYLDSTGQDILIEPIPDAGPY
ncbi:DUF1398 domain-containing protein [Hydromonas duriensis]|uniref:Uncharacterized protein YbcV (DUF1398 family) n=1 Tax=Hydromonas duriensis TaxID=1527608 RepID=A0A4R6Y2B1_9BURK|nr:DUF1398 family protein [Hydromonas duriensis]TDR30670.1 uncharacterized protein YbcV (DUF1398 family) [Hydromonas duriensis]